MIDQNKKSDISILGIIPIFIGISIFSWFIFLPGKISYKWSVLLKYFVEKQETLALSFGVISINLALLIFIFISMTGLGQLGDRIKRYRKESKSNSLNFNILYVFFGLVFGYLIWNIFDPFSGLLPFPSVVPGHQITYFIVILKYSTLSLFGFTVNAILTQLTKNILAQKSRKIPSFPKGGNTLVVGAVNEI